MPWGEEELEFDLPRGWRLAGIVEPDGTTPVSNVGSEVERALNSPVGCPPLAQMCRGRRTVAVVVDDSSRPTPAGLFMDRLLDEVNRAGIAYEDITLVTGTGTHSPMSDDEMERKVGKAALSKVRWLNHDCRDAGALVRIGRTGRGTPVEVNSIVAAADMVILVGTVEPHPHAGFGGGYKNIVPGVAGARTIGENHLLSATPRNFSMVGWFPEDNPMRLDAEEAGEMLKGSCFMVNTVLTPGLDIAKIFAGDPVKAHREGVRFSRGIYGVEIERRVDVVISSSHPMDHDLRQGVKAVANTFTATREGGLVIAAMRCLGGAGDMSVPKIKVPASPVLIRAMARSLLPVVKYLPFGIPVEERFYMYTALRTVLRNRVKVYAPEIPLQVRKRIGFLFALGGFEEVLQEAASLYREADVLVFPRGGVTYPIIEDRTTPDRKPGT